MTMVDQARRSRAPGAPAEVELHRVGARRRRRELPRWLVRTTTPVLLLLAWWLASTTGLLSERVLPGPAAMWQTAVSLTLDGQLPEAMWVSLQRAAAGTAVGLVIGVSLAIVAGLTQWGEDLVDAPMQMVRALPWAGMMPIFVIWFGIDETSKIALVALATVFPFYINTFTGIRGVDAALVAATQTLGLGRAQRVRHVLLPGALPNALVGLRYALGSAWIALVFAEQVNATSGIGYLISSGREMFRVDIVIVALLVYALVGLIVDLIVRLMERGWLRWRLTYSGS